MRLFIQHATELNYSEPITETVMEVRQKPVNDHHQALRAFRIDVSPRATAYEHRDWLDNHVHLFSILPPHDHVQITARSVVETEAEATYPDLDAVRAALVADPELQQLDFLRFGGPIIEVAALHELAKALELPEEGQPGVVVERITRYLLEHIQYMKGVTTSATSIDQVLEHRSGVCQDIAHVAAGLLRAKRIPVRYVSGYLYRAEGAEELETHAWCEVNLAGYGWVGVDPTHRCAVGPGHVAVAVGRDFSDVPPNRGVYKGAGEETLSVHVSIHETEERPEGLLAVDLGEVDAPKELPAIPTIHREEIEYQQAQQQQ